MFRSQKYFYSAITLVGLILMVAKLKNNSNLKGNNIFYICSKNKRKFDFTLHSKAVRIIEILKNYPLQSDAGYIFLILESQHDTATKIDARIESALN